MIDPTPYDQRPLNERSAVTTPGTTPYSTTPTTYPPPTTPSTTLTPPPATPPNWSATTTGGTSTRPTGVTILAILFAIGAVFALLGALAWFAGGAALDAGEAEGFGAVAVFVGLLSLVFAVVYAVIAWGLWSGQRWSWYAALVLAVLGGIMNLFSLFTGQIFTGLIALVLVGLVLWYLFRPEVMSFFRVQRPAALTGRPA